MCRFPLKMVTLATSSLCVKTCQSVISWKKVCFTPKQLSVLTIYSTFKVTHYPCAFYSSGATFRFLGMFPPLSVRSMDYLEHFQVHSTVVLLMLYHRWIIHNFTHVSHRKWPRFKRVGRQRSDSAHVTPSKLDALQQALQPYKRTASNIYIGNWYWHCYIQCHIGCTILSRQIQQLWLGHTIGRTPYLRRKLPEHYWLMHWWLKHYGQLYWICHSNQGFIGR